jgi:hypothetical protein
MLENNTSFQVINSAFPHIGKKLDFLWGHKEFHTLMEDLQQEKRGVQRQGFPPTVLTALFSLASDHDREFPNLVVKVTDIWRL